MNKKIKTAFSTTIRGFLIGAILTATQAFADQAVVSDAKGCTNAGSTPQPSTVPCTVIGSCNTDGTVNSCVMTNARGATADCKSDFFLSKYGNICRPRIPGAKSPVGFLSRFSGCIQGPDATGLTVNVQGTGAVTSSDGIIDCPAGFCSNNYIKNSKVKLTAKQTDVNSNFTGWSDPSCTGTGTCIVTMSSAKSVTATFSWSGPTYGLTVNMVDTSGAPLPYLQARVSSTPDGISCGGTCTGFFRPNASVNLTAESLGSQYTFTGWSGDCSGDTCSLAMNAAHTVTAKFKKNPANYAINLSIVSSNGALVPSGQLLVSSSPAGMNCQSNCSGLFTPNSSVSLYAGSLGSRFTFIGWSGDCDGGSCNLSMTSNHSVTANVKENPATYPLTVAMVDAAGNPLPYGQASITSSPGGISCAGGCTGNFTPNSIATLSATSSQYDFAGWTGDCSGTTCSVAMTGARTATAHFQPKCSSSGCTLTAAQDPNSTGLITSSPAGISCSGTCSKTFPPGSVVTLTYTPNVGNTFTGWSGGGCSGTAPSCTVTVNSNLTVTAAATVNTERFDLTVAVDTGPGTATVTPGGATCSYPNTCVFHLAANTYNIAGPSGATYSYPCPVNGCDSGCKGSGPCNVVLPNSAAKVYVHNLAVGGGCVANGNSCGVGDSCCSGQPCTNNSCPAAAQCVSPGSSCNFTDTCCNGLACIANACGGSGGSTTGSTTGTTTSTTTGTTTGATTGSTTSTTTGTTGTTTSTTGSATTGGSCLARNTACSASSQCCSTICAPSGTSASPRCQ
jgi:uncharacterized repeat protein (TIGR02543 family)